MRSKRTSWWGYETAMGTYHLEDENKSSSSFPWIELYSAFAASISFLCVGIIQSVMPLILDSMRTEASLRVDADGIQWMSSTPYLGAALGGLMSGFLLEYLGRKKTILILITLYIPGWLLAGLAVNAPMLFAGVALIGAAAGIGFAAVPIYIAECVRPGRRGRLSLLPFMMMALGVVILVPLGPRIKGWKEVALSMAGLCKIATIICIWLPESPVWLLLRGKENEAYDCLVKIRGDGHPHLVRKELEEIRESMKEAKEAVENRRWLGLMRRQIIWWPTWLTLSLLVFQQFIGISAGVIPYMDNILRDVGSVSNGTKLALTQEEGLIVEGVVQLIPVLLAVALIDWIGRRALLLTSAALIIICHMLLGTYFYSCHQRIVVIMELSSWFPSVSLYALLASYALGFASVPFIVMSEAFPAQWRGNISAVAVVANSLAAFLVVHFFEYLRHTLFPGYVFFLFGIICVIACVLITLAMPETRGESLARIQRSFDSNVGYFNDYNDAMMAEENRAMDDLIRSPFKVNAPGIQSPIPLTLL